MTASDMVRRVGERRGITVSMLRGRRRVASIARARHEAMWVLREATEMSFPEIGRELGGMDHSSVIHGYRKISVKVAARPAYGEELLGLVRPVKVERLGCSNVSCSGCVPQARAE